MEFCIAQALMYHRSQDCFGRQCLSCCAVEAGASHKSVLMQNGMNGMQEVVTCNVTSTTDDQAASPCARGYVCAPLPQADIRAADNAAQSASTWGLSPIGNPLQGALVPLMALCTTTPSSLRPFGMISALMYCINLSSELGQLQHQHARYHGAWGLGRPSCTSVSAGPRRGASLPGCCCAGAAMGVCASPDGVALPVGPTVPVPTAYFPLTNGSTFSWPIPEYWAYNTSAIQSKQTKFVKDSYFGTVVQCNASLGELQCDDGP